MRFSNQIQAQGKCPVALDYTILQSSWIKTTASWLSHELGENGEKKSSWKLGY